MAWQPTQDYIELLDRVVDLRLRGERVQLARQATGMALMLKQAGVDSSKLNDLIQKLVPEKRLSPEIDLVTFKRTGTWRKRYLTVVTKPGSVF